MTRPVTFGKWLQLGGRNRLQNEALYRSLSSLRYLKLLSEKTLLHQSYKPREPFRDGNMKSTTVHNSVQSAEKFKEVATTQRWYAISIISNCLDMLARVLIYVTPNWTISSNLSLWGMVSLCFLMLSTTLLLRNLLLSKPIPSPVAFNMTGVIKVYQHDT